MYVDGGGLISEMSRGRSSLMMMMVGRLMITAHLLFIVLSPGGVHCSRIQRREEKGQFDR